MNEQKNRNIQLSDTDLMTGHFLAALIVMAEFRRISNPFFSWYIICSRLLRTLLYIVPLNNNVQMASECHVKYLVKLRSVYNIINK